MLFPWLEPIWQCLVAYRTKNRIPSAIMLCGLSGIGKTQLAHLYAQYILCSQPTALPCGQCRSCVLFQAGNHPDFFKVQPQENSASIKIDQVRTLVNDLGQTPGLGGYQVALIANAEDMNRAAANSLLKTLEEPRGKVLLLLQSNQPLAVPATIRSRCQLIRIPVPSQAQSANWLATQLTSEQNPTSYLAMADYLPLKALDYANNVQVKLRDALLTALQDIHADKIDPTKAAAEFLTQPKEVIQFLMMMVTDMIRINFSAKNNLNHYDKMQELIATCRNISVQELFKFLDALQEAAQALVNRSNVNLQLLLENLFITWRYSYDVS